MKIQNTIPLLTDRKFQIVTRFFGIFLFLYIALITSWISDDAQITFRTILNFISGLGITFNFGERVQAFTHPLWFLLLSSVIAITRELFVTTQIVSIVISILAIIVLTKMEIKLQNGKLVIVSPIFFLAFSWAFCDYMTSGLENPLTYLLVSLLLYCLFCTDKERNLKFIFLILSLIVLNRLDYGLIFLPLALVLMYTFIDRKNYISVLWMGVSLLTVWFLFSTIYFGSPLPNTFYAKLNADYPTLEVLSRGINYYVALFLDFNSVIIMLLGFISLIFYRDRFTIALIVGKILYFLYILRAGGDFMQGRFFSVLILVSIGEFVYAIHKSQISIKFKNKFILSFFTLIVCFSIPSNAPIYSKTDYDSRPKYKGIVDERGFYYWYSGLLSTRRENWPKFIYLEEELLSNYRVFCGGLGINSLTNYSIVIIDSCGLADPYLSRLPAIRSPNWRVGHHNRKLPTEYGLLKTGKLQEIPDQNLQSLFKDISTVVSDDLFTVSRIKAIWRLLINSYPNMDLSKYSNPNVWVPLTNVVEKYKITDWNSDIFHANFNGNLRYEADTPIKTSVIRVKADWAHSYELFVNDQKIYTLQKEGKPCENGLKLHLPDEQIVKSIQISEIDVTKWTHNGYNYLELLRLNENKVNEISLEPHCIIKI